MTINICSVSQPQVLCAGSLAVVVPNRGMQQRKLFKKAATVEQDNISSEVVRNVADVQKTDASATQPVKVTYPDAVKGNTESKQVKSVSVVSPLTLKI
jgi:hypothetical protein